MFRSFLLILFLCGLTAVSVVLEYKASAETFACPPTRVCLPKAPPPCETLPCVPDVKPPDCEPLNCDVSRPLLRRACAHAWRKHLRETVRRSPPPLCFVDVKFDKLQTVARVSTANIMRAMSQ
ncbi:hypothetical protein F4009_22200 [Candidatus Poribacteria bacterium]|nr:hypothetical protein [Candidatus Poribacteria bacterium]MYH82532.1 hypothetical protein [Candidatus Poribacteria bacterium]MYK96672.1 hypothetical protein [Candidatus Poribacteria bacterium]